MKTIFRHVPYRGTRSKYERCRLDVHIPEEFAGGYTLVWFYGGGMVAGERALPPGLADQGVAVVTPDYRLSPGVRAPAYIRDAAAAVAWTFHNIDSFGGHPEKVVVAGASAGGYLASMVVLDKNWLAPYKMDANQVAALVSISGQAINHFTVRRERGIPEQAPWVDRLAPLHHVRADAPPILLVTGDRELELLGRYEENAYFLRMLKIAGHQQHELHELPGRDHGAVEKDALPLVLDFIRGLADPSP